MSKAKATIVFCSKDTKEDEGFISNIKSMAGCDIDIIPKVGYDQITKAYNEALDEANTDLVIFCHNDILIKTDGFVNILLELFSKSKKGIIGLVGSNAWDGGSWAGKKSHAVGHLIQCNKYHPGLPKYILFSPKFRKKELIPVVTCDGMFIAVMKSRVKERFDEVLKGFHFYDVMFTIDNVLKGVDAAVTYKILALHKSEGMLNDQWYESQLYSKFKYGENYRVQLDLPEGGNPYMENYDRNKKYI
ncbi:MAG: glycosyltransferase [Prevotella sp.]